MAVPRIVVAPDKFKGSLSASAAADAMTAGARDVLPPDAVVLPRPVADGGEGTVEAALAAGHRAERVAVTGPTGARVQARYAVRDRTAVVELAEASGLRALPDGRPDPLHATTHGTGELVRAALDAGARRIVLGIGGSTTTDGGTGMAAALGAAFLDADGRPLPPGGAALLRLDRIDVDGLDPRLRDVEVVVACDVDNPLTGPRGAAAVYGPQKGATPDDVQTLDRALCRYAEVLRRDRADVAAVPGAGAAGGVGAGALAFLGARLTSGIDLVIDFVGLRDAVVDADLVLTGEGSLDAQTLHGKAPAGVARVAAEAAVPVVAIAGVVDLDEPTWRAAGFAAAYALADRAPDLATARRDAAGLVRLVSADAVRRSFGSATSLADPATRSTTSLRSTA